MHIVHMTCTHCELVIQAIRILIWWQYGLPMKEDFKGINIVVIAHWAALTEYLTNVLLYVTNIQYNLYYIYIYYMTVDDNTYYPTAIKKYCLTCGITLSSVW